MFVCSCKYYKGTKNEKISEILMKMKAWEDTVPTV